MLTFVIDDKNVNKTSNIFLYHSFANFQFAKVNPNIPLIIQKYDFEPDIETVFWIES